MLVQLGDYEVPVEIEKKNNKNVYFRVKEDGTLYVTCNRFVSQRDINRMIKDNEKSLKNSDDEAVIYSDDNKDVVVLTKRRYRKKIRPQYRNKI